MQPTLEKILIWDAPTRVFHWSFALLVCASLVLGLGADGEGVLFHGHMLCGLGAVGVLVLRVIHGFVGTRHSRFASFPMNPAELVRYLVGVFRGGAKRYAGHNPGSAWAALLMGLLVVGLVLTGLGGATGDLGEVHELLANVLMLVILAHLAGLALHAWQYYGNIALAMVTGQKVAPTGEAIRSARTGWGLAFLAATVGWVAMVFGGYDRATGTVRLPGVGVVISLDGQKARNGADQNPAHPHHRGD